MPSRPGTSMPPTVPPVAAAAATPGPARDMPPMILAPVPSLPVYWRAAVVRFASSAFSAAYSESVWLPVSRPAVPAMPTTRSCEPASRLLPTLSISLVPTTLWPEIMLYHQIFIITLEFQAIYLPLLSAKRLLFKRYSYSVSGGSQDGSGSSLRSGGASCG